MKNGRPSELSHHGWIWAEDVLPDEYREYNFGVLVSALVPRSIKSWYFFQVCHPVPSEACRDEPREICTQEESCKDIPKKDCHLDYKEVSLSLYHSFPMYRRTKQDRFTTCFKTYGTNSFFPKVLKSYHKSAKMSEKGQIQWWSEIRISLDFKWSKRGWFANILDLKWDLKSWSPTLWNADKWPPLCPTPFEILTPMSGFKMVWFWN